MADNALTLAMSTYEDKSWHLLAVLLKIGRSVSPHHLASQCQLFAASPDFVRHVASSPESPLSLSDSGGRVMPSAVAVFALGRFFGFGSRVGFRDSEPRGLRKRKGFFASDDEVNEGRRDHKRLAISNEVQVQRFFLESNADSVMAIIPAIQFESQNMHSGDAGNAIISLQIDTNRESSSCPAWNFEHREADNDASMSMFQGEIAGSVIKASDSLFMTRSDLACQKLEGIDGFNEGNLFANLALATSFHDLLLCKEAAVGSSGLGKKMDNFETFRHEFPEQNVPSMDDGICKSNTCKEPGSKTGFGVSDAEREKVDVAQMVNPVGCIEQSTGLEFEPKTHRSALNLDNDESVRNIGTQSTCKIAQSNSKQHARSSGTLKGGQKRDLHTKSQVLMESAVCNKFDNAPNIDQCKNDQKFDTKLKSKQSRKENMNMATTSMTAKVEKKVYPSFEPFMIEEEEGSGGYGTVYRARRKTDGKRLAIKCPHNNAHKNHVNNERNMLERFGGKNFVIKFEGSFKSGSSDCFVLEHVEHDRPEVLKKEIDIIQLQWYGYCMFRALACLHKEGVVHRDVKPGNFLFSRKLNKGYLIDFNLAMDLKQKYNIGSKSKQSVGASNITLRTSSASLVQDKNLDGSKALTSNKRDVKQKAYAGLPKNCPNKAGRHFLQPQGTDGSGITSAKDVTSTRTASAERLREPLPFRGRKELISLVQNSLQGANSCPLKGPSSQRKRVTAPSGKVDSKIVYITPMPLHSSIIPAGLSRSKGDGKHKREAPCVGTKGFRAPEVLFRSQFQGPKVDIWSAGVTLLYMVIGKSPFTGDPEQNIKEIARLRGSEELWEVARLHDREFAFPVELFDDRYLQSWDIESWCKINTKRPDFLQHIPKSLFDLIDKCLTVNPRNRISVEEVLRHEFFASCHEIMRKQKMIRRSLSSDTAAASGTI